MESSKSSPAVRPAKKRGRQSASAAASFLHCPPSHAINSCSSRCFHKMEARESARDPRDSPTSFSSSQPLASVSTQLADFGILLLCTAHLLVKAHPQDTEIGGSMKFEYFFFKNEQNHGICWTGPMFLLRLCRWHQPNSLVKPNESSRLSTVKRVDMQMKQMQPSPNIFGQYLKRRR